MTHGGLDETLDWNYHGTGFDMHPRIKVHLMKADHTEQVMKDLFKRITDILDELPPNQRQQEQIDAVRAIIATEGW